MPLANEFYVTVSKTVASPWDLNTDLPEHYPVDCRYFGRALQNVDRILGNRGFRFYMVWNLDDIPSRGRNVIVLLIGDERYQVPRYAADVLAVFKTGALWPFRPYVGRNTRIVLKMLDDLRSVRDYCLRLVRCQPSRYLEHNVFPIPLGYHQQLSVSFRRFVERTTDVFFAGSRGEALRPFHPKTWLLRPRTAARNAMFEALESLIRRYPHIVCESLSVGGAQPGFTPRAYSEKLMNSKISLCPRGNFPETFRIFESARAGCVIVSEPLPQVWYFNNIPAQIVGDWSDAPDLIATLFQSPDALEEIHQRTKMWWNELASEEALARFMARQIEILTEH